MAGTFVHRRDSECAVIEQISLNDCLQTLSGLDRLELGIAEMPRRLEVLHELRLVMHKPCGGQVDIGLLRSPEWIADYGAHVGGTVWLNMPEMGVEGEAEVLDIGPAQVYDVRPGLVTGTFKHTSAEVYDLKLESEAKLIRVTGTHPFWSVDREVWVSVLDLEIGETLKTLDGTTVVESRVRGSEPEPVYNIEVEGDHCYRVGESGVLVHNASPNYSRTTTVNVTWFGQSIVRSGGASFVVTDSTLGTGTPFQRASNLPVWWGALTTQFRNGDWQRGHLIGNQLGGPGGTEWRNMVPLHRRANDPGMQECEEIVKERAKCGESVNLVVTPTYGNRQVVPLFVHMKATVIRTNEVLFDVNVPNQLNANAPSACRI